MNFPNIKPQKMFCNSGNSGIANYFWGLKIWKIHEFFCQSFQKMLTLRFKRRKKNVLTLFCILKHLKNSEYDVENLRDCLIFRSVQKKRENLREGMDPSNSVK
jgi:hypothetical protein